MSEHISREEIQNLIAQTVEAQGGAAGHRHTLSRKIRTHRDTERRLSNCSPSGMRFSWRVARAFVMLKTQPAESFSVCGVPFSAWPRTKIPTLGASPASCRVQVTSITCIHTLDSAHLRVKVSWPPHTCHHDADAHKSSGSFLRHLRLCGHPGQ